MKNPGGGNEAKLDQLLVAYGRAFDEVEPSTDYLDGVWQRIEASDEQLSTSSGTKLDRLFAAYRKSFEEIQASADFLPGVWAKVGAAQQPGWLLSAERRLNRLFAAYGGTFTEIEPSVNFMSTLWAKIEQSKPAGWVSLIRSWAPRLATAGVAAAMLLSLSLELQQRARPERALLQSSYIDALTSDSLDEHDHALWTLAGYRR